MHKVTSHQVDPTNADIKITATDDQVEYLIEPSNAGHMGLAAMTVNFQRGNPTEAGFNGLTVEALLAITADRIDALNKGEFRCRENSLAITHIEEAMNWLMARSHKRIQRGVYGTKTP